MQVVREAAKVYAGDGHRQSSVLLTMQYRLLGSWYAALVCSADVVRWSRMQPAAYDVGDRSNVRCGGSGTGHEKRHSELFHHSQFADHHSARPVRHSQLSVSLVMIPVTTLP
jgi:hypothetical protein